MKKFIPYVLIILVCCAIAVLDMFVVNSQPTTYATTAVVTELDTENDTVICADYNGEIWRFYGVEDWQINDVATMTMDTRGTKDIHDDEILSTRYSGNMAGWNNKTGSR